MTRKEAREQAFILIFEKSFRDEPMEEIIADAVQCRLIAPNAYADGTAAGVFDHLDEIDAAVSANLRGWALDRLSRVALAVLRLAVYEIFYLPEIPESVSINEAVELTKKFATEEDAAYVNGVLGSIVRAKAPGAVEADQTESGDPDA